MDERKIRIAYLDSMMVVAIIAVIWIRLSGQNWYSIMGIYLVHPLIIELLNKVGINTLCCHSIISIPVGIMVIFGIALSLAIVLKRIQFIGGYLG